MTTDPQSDVERARTELAATVKEIENRLNLPKAARRSLTRVADTVADLRADHPIVFAGTALGALAAIGGAVWFAIRTLRK